MNTTTITATGVNGQTVRKELAAKGEIVVITTGTPRTGIRHTVAKVTGWDTRSITGTGYSYYVTTAVAADGEELTDTRVRPATDAEAAAYDADTTPAAEAPSEIVPAEHTALVAHETGCLTCRVASSSGRYCAEGMRLWNAAHTARHDFDRAPIITVNRYGRRHCFWNAHEALGEVGINGGEILKAPAGMIETARREQAQAKAERDARMAAWRAAGRPRTARPNLGRY